MRIVIDMQGAQSSASWNRGVGRYTLSLALAMVRNRGNHEIVLALNGAFPEAVERLRAIFENLISKENIQVWNAPIPMAYLDEKNELRRNSGELVREAFLASLNPDIVVISSLFEGLVDDAVTSIKKLPDDVLTSMVLYDLIPFIHKKPYLENPIVEAWYLEKIEHMRQADLWLSISASAGSEGVDYLNLTAENCINISTDADECFQEINFSLEQQEILRKKYNLPHSFVMYTGGIDFRKNIEGLIRAYAKLPAHLRSNHQLAIVCSVQDASRTMLLDLAKNHGLKKDEVVLTGFVPEEDLIALYNLCTLFVFPSFHEGFGLPALEAMRCGAPVIAANTSSLPEVIKFEEALFDPYSDDAITSAIERVLTNVIFREQLVAHCRQQAQKFSWDESARVAIAAMENTLQNHHAGRIRNVTSSELPRMAFVSPLPPERSGISDYSADLLPALSKFYDIEVVVVQDKITDPWVNTNCVIRSVEWFTQNTSQYDRVLYHFGNSSFHQHMFGLLQQIPGVVVLHDFYLSGVIHYMDATGYAAGSFPERLYSSHGYRALLDHTKNSDIADVIWKYPCSLEVIAGSIGTIVHSKSSLRLAKNWFGEMNNVSVIPLLRNIKKSEKSSDSRTLLGLPKDAYIVCSFGMIGPTKLNHQIVQAWLNSELAKNNNCYLIFVGENHAGEYGNDLLTQIKSSPCSTRILITGWTDPDTYKNYLSAANVGVQLRTLSRGETSAAVLDCMNYGLATIVNANGSMADLDDDAVLKLPDEFDVQELTEALESLWLDEKTRHKFSANARQVILEQHDPDGCAQQYWNTIEQFYSYSKPTIQPLLNALASLPLENVTDNDIALLSESIAVSFPPKNSVRQLFIDISELVKHDARTGIQRVVRNILKELLINPPLGWRIEPAYATVDQPYRYAREFTFDFLGLEITGFEDEVIDFSSGDFFFCLDYQPQVQESKADFFQKIRNHGVTVKFMIYDMLCIQMPHYFVPGAADGYLAWLKVVSESDGAICISKSVSDDFSNWIEGKTWNRKSLFSNNWFHLGADINKAHDEHASAIKRQEKVVFFRQRITMLMVGTIEPRKGHAQTLDAFEHLWQKGFEINLCIVGKQGWMVEELIERINYHSELNERLFWLEGISDEYLEEIYSACTCLIAASYGEGFGLPLIEAAQHNLPIIARDIPIFREVAGEHAFYFNSIEPNEFANEIQDWLELYEKDQHPRSDAMPWLTWKESSQNLLDLVLNNNDLNSVEHKQRGSNFD